MGDWKAELKMRENATEWPRGSQRERERKGHIGAEARTILFGFSMHTDPVILFFR